MIFRGNHVKFARFVFLVDLFIFTCLEINYQFYLLFFHSVYYKTVIRFGFCDIQKIQGLSKGDNLYIDLYYFGYHKNLF